MDACTFVAGQNQILIDRHGHTLIERKGSHVVSNARSDQQVTKCTRQLIALGQ